MKSGTIACPPDTELLAGGLMDRDDFSGIRVRMTDLNVLRTLWNEELEKEASRITEQRYGTPRPWEVFQHIDEIYREASLKVDYQAIAEETDRFLFELSDLYIEASAEQRDQIRRMLGENKSILSVLWGHIHNAADQLAQTGDRAWLHRGLALASMEDCRVDYRDTYLALCFLCTKAEQQGIDTAPYFRRGELGEIALDASEKTGMGFYIPAPEQSHD